MNYNDFAKEVHENAVADKPVIAIKAGKSVACFISAKVAEEITGIKKANICKVLKGERNFAGGYVWKYAACGGELEIAE